MIPPPDGDLPPEYWDAVLWDPRAVGKPWLPLQQMRLSEIPREVLRVECARCARGVEIQRVDAVKLYGPHAVSKDVGQPSTRQRLPGPDWTPRRGSLLAELAMINRASP